MSNKVGVEATNGHRYESTAQTVHPKPSLLVVEDDHVLRTMFSTALQDEFEVLTAADGESALSEFVMAKREIDLVITDLEMPGSNGIELMMNLPESVPVIVVTGFLNRLDFTRMFDPPTIQACATTTREVRSPNF